MKRLILLLSFVGGAVLVAAPPAGTELRLVLLIAIDQFRYDYLTRFRGEYQEGLKKLLTEGAVFTDANLEHYPTVTAIAHSTMLSGATPSVSGIIGNDWYDRGSATTVTSVSDPSTTQLEGVSGPGASPHRLLVSTVGDELKMAASRPKGDPDGPRVIGVSLKDRSAILPVGRGADAAYWCDTKNGAFVTSTYYMKEAPEWVRAFNGRKPADQWIGRPWARLAAAADVLFTLPNEPTPAYYGALYGTPYGNELLLDFASQALEREKLGQRGAVDLLSVSFSSNDAVGHTYGPDSPHVRDIAIRTDRVIGGLLARVDQLVGLSHTIVALTADHGVAPLPEVQQQRSMPGGRLANTDLFDPIQEAMVAAYGEGRWILSTAGSSPYFNDALIAERKLNPADVRRLAARAAAGVPHVTRVYTRDDLLQGAVPNDRIGQRILRGFFAPRSGDLEVLFEPYWIRQAAGTTHGTPYNYDAHIPLIVMGAPIKPGEYTAPVALNDLAPTLATLARVEIPSGSVGRVLTEALRPVSTPDPAPTRPSR